MCGQINADYAFLVDASGSILPNEFNTLKTFVKRVVQFLDIAPALTHVGLIRYSTGANLELKFSSSYDKAEILRLIDEIALTDGITRIDLALKVASEELFTADGGMRAQARKVRHNQLLNKIEQNQLNVNAEGKNQCKHGDVLLMHIKCRKKNLHVKITVSMVTKITKQIKTQWRKDFQICKLKRFKN